MVIEELNPSTSLSNPLERLVHRPENRLPHRLLYIDYFRMWRISSCDMRKPDAPKLPLLSAAVRVTSFELGTIRSRLSLVSEAEISIAVVL